MRILLAEDEPGISSFMIRGLSQQGYAVDLVDNGKDGAKMARINTYDLIITDYMMPEMDGIEMTQAIRANKVTAPILMLTVIDDEENVIRALDSGADDYLTKPFSFNEMLARVRALMRREQTLVGNTLSFEGIELDLAKRTVRRGGQEVNLSRKEFSLLEYFLRNPEVVLTRNMILEHVWDYSIDPFTNTVDVHVRYLRKKVDEPFSKRLIHTVHGIGYKLSERSASAKYASLS